jgi:hypothetical protein
MKAHRRLVGCSWHDSRNPKTELRACYCHRQDVPPSSPTLHRHVDGGRGISRLSIGLLCAGQDAPM